MRLTVIEQLCYYWGHSKSVEEGYLTINEETTSPLEEGGKKGRRQGKFYEAALTEMERLLLSEARELEGLDEEIALLRVKLLSALKEQPGNDALYLKQASLLVKAVATRYRLGNRAEKRLYETVEGVLKDLGLSLLPEREK
ncbi:MAG: hypothetical protein HY673_04030 [Chloroflexi bacterium]|nr:hypothetical protein [Chloroflexota bacterium]